MKFKIVFKNRIESEKEKFELQPDIRHLWWKNRRHFDSVSINKNINDKF